MGEETNNELVFASIFLDLLTKYGIPAAVEIIAAWDWEGEEGPTIDDIVALRDAVPDSESYFEDDPEDPEAA